MSDRIRSPNFDKTFVSLALKSPSTKVIWGVLQNYADVVAYLSLPDVYQIVLSGVALMRTVMMRWSMEPIPTSVIGTVACRNKILLRLVVECFHFLASCLSFCQIPLFNCL